MNEFRYGFSKTVEKTTMADAIARVTDALAEEGFGVLTEIDVAATLKKKLDVDHPPYRILGACNPPLAHQALQAEPQIGLLLPCNVVVQEPEKGTVVISALNPSTMFELVDNDGVKTIAEDVEARLRRVIEKVAG